MSSFGVVDMKSLNSMSSQELFALAQDRALSKGSFGETLTYLERREELFLVWDRAINEQSEH